jgi:hypothetical protein
VRVAPLVCTGGSKEWFERISPISLTCVSSQKRNRGRVARRRAVAAAATDEVDEDLWQFKDRKGWYEAKFSASDMPDWNPLTFLSSEEVGPGLRELTYVGTSVVRPSAEALTVFNPPFPHLSFRFEYETSRELVPLRNAYKHVGQYAQIRVNGMEEVVVAPSSEPINPKSIRASLLRVRNDLAADEKKVERDPISEPQRLTVLVQTEEAPDLSKGTISDLYEIGPFSGSGLAFGSIQAVFRFPTICIFADNAGIATARALIKSEMLQPSLRDAVHLYYKAPNKASMMYQDEYDEFEGKYGVKVFTSTRDTFQEMFDEDYTLVYEPEATAAVILTGREPNEAEEEALEACKAAEIVTLVRQTEERPETEWLSSVGDMSGL